MSKNTKIYIMKRDGFTDHFEMHVSTTRKVMYNHMQKIYKENNKPCDNLEGLKGCVTPVFSCSKSNNDLFCYLFLNEEDLGVSVVGHECLHVCMTHERVITRFNMDYNLKDIGKDEERLCYFYSDVIKGVYNTLYENKHIKEDRRIK